MCVWDYCSIGTTDCTLDQIFWLMIFSVPEESEDNPPLLFHLVSFEPQIRWQQNSPHSKILPPPRHPNILPIVVAKQLSFCFI